MTIDESSEPSPNVETPKGAAPRDERARRLDAARMSLHAARHLLRHNGGDTTPPPLRRN